MQIRMLKTENGSVDGIKVAQYAEGTEYDLTATAGERDLAAAFVGAGLAVDIDANPEQALAPAAEQSADPVAQEAVTPALKPARQKKQ
jgi:hypothetical protein